MNFKDLKEKIEGLHLNKQDLEAVLLQAAVIEGVLKEAVSFSYWMTTRSKDESAEEQKDKVVSAFLKRIRGMNFSGLIEVTFNMEFISREEKKKLNAYRQERNKLQHYLLEKVTVSDNGLEEAVRDLYRQGKDILDGNMLAAMSKLLESSQEGAIEQKQ